MNKRKYIMTPKGEWFKVEVWDEYGNYTSVYEKNVIQSSLFIIKWWNDTENREESNKLMNRAIISMNKIDKENGILTGNCDGLD